MALPKRGPLIRSLWGLDGSREEAVAIATYCAIVAKDFEHGVLLAANHSGDSHSTASMTGQLLGLVHGEQAIPERWLKELELREVITQVGRDLAAVRARQLDVEQQWERYPGW